MSTIPRTFGAEDRFVKNPHDFYETPFELALSACKIVDCLHPNPDRILDPGAGTGVWGRAARQMWPHAFIAGVEIDPKFARDPSYDLFWRENYPDYYLPMHKVTVGNPPYSSKTNRNLAMDFVLRALENTFDGGVVAFLLKTEFSGSAIRYEKLFKPHRPHSIYHSICRVPFFKHTKNTNTINYSLFVWYKVSKQYEQTLTKWWDWRKGGLDVW